MIDYKLLNSQIKAMADGEKNKIGLLANVAALIKEATGWLWVGFYLVKDDELLLGPFQGSVACLRITRGKGVCGTAWQKGTTVIVPDVEQFPGHIACSTLSRSEIVVPIFVKDEIVGVLDVDSEDLNSFTETDAEGLENICATIAENF